MLSLTAVLASLPPASLAETDLARFVAQTLGRRTRQELPGLASLFAEEALRGYPPHLNAILASACDALVATQADPQLLDSRACDALLGSRLFMSRLSERVDVRRQRLRPGTLVVGELRVTLGPRLTILPGVGRELMLVAPVDLAQVPDARFSMPLGVVIAKPGSAAEGDLYRHHWAALEEAFGLAGPLADRWTARYFAIARRENHDARVARDGLTPLTAETRRRLFDAIIGHLRDQELPEQHRPGRRGLEQRLASLGLELDRPWVEPLLAIVEGTYKAAALDPDVIAGRCPCPREDLTRWLSWVDVPGAHKKAIAALEPAELELLLVALADTEAGRADGLVPAHLERPLASLRDACLRPRWQRAAASLSGVDPLLAVDHKILSGDDRQTIAERLAALAAEAQQHLASTPLPTSAEATPPDPAQDPRPRAAPRPPRRRPAPDTAPQDTAPQDSAPQVTSPPAPDPGALPAPTPPRPADTQVVTPSPTSPAPAEATAPQPTPAPDIPAVAPPRFHLPPLPEIPPPRPAPRVRPRTDLPPLPPVPLPDPALLARAPTSRPPSSGDFSARPPSSRPPSARPPSAHPASSRPALTSASAPEPPVRPLASPAAPPTARPTVAAQPVRSGPRPATTPASPARVNLERDPRERRSHTIPHLVTPAQGNAFYDAAFKELELIERDLLQRGPNPRAVERTDAIGREARELHDALGPSARSGDHDFLAAQHRLEKVLAYLERLGPLLAGDPLPAPDDRGASLLSRLFRRKTRGT